MTRAFHVLMALSMLCDICVGLYALLNGVWWLLVLACCAMSWLAMHLYAQFVMLQRKVK